MHAWERLRASKQVTCEVGVAREEPTMLYHFKSGGVWSARASSTQRSAPRSGAKSSGCHPSASAAHSRRMRMARPLLLRLLLLRAGPVQCQNARKKKRKTPACMTGGAHVAPACACGSEGHSCHPSVSGHAHSQPHTKLRHFPRARRKACAWRPIQQRSSRMHTHA